MTSTEQTWWVEVHGASLAQGDYLPDCSVPVFGGEYGARDLDSEEVPVDARDCIVLTQSCDLENEKASFVALCPLHSIADFERVNPAFSKKGEWEQVRKGRIDALHLIASISDPKNNRMCLVADFREIYSLPIKYLQGHASQLGNRWRLQSPFLEHFSQAFARFFMRVGLPSNIPPFK
jgi:hypothetical protein